MDKTTSTDGATSSFSASTALPLLPSHDEQVIPLSKFPALSVFKTSTTYPALIVPVRRTAELRRSLSKVLLHLPKTKNVHDNPDDQSTRKLVLSSDNGWQDERVQYLLSSEHGDIQKSHHTITLGYEDRTVDEILRQVLPDTITELPTAFEIVGSIAHLNLREELLPYKYMIGKVILDKNQPRIQTVVNKLGMIANEYRTFGMEVIAGDDSPNWSIVTVKEEGCEFMLDFQQVYWNSRLGAEHKRLVQLIRKDAQTRQKTIVVADLMAGVGPFAVPLTACLSSKQTKKSKQKGNPEATATIVVHANDLNPASCKYLKINAEKNNCPSNKLFCYNMDARGFCHMLQQQSTEDSNSKPIEFDHVIMNLPATAPELLDAFRGFTNTTLPRIHVYCFASKPITANTNANATTDVSNSENDMTTLQEEIDEAVRQRCSTALGCPLDASQHNVSIRIVRDVSPKKNMLCVSFDLPETVRSLPRIAVVNDPSTHPKTNETTAEMDQQKPQVNDGDPPEPKRTKTS